MSTSTIEQRPEQDGPGPTEGHAAVPVGFWLLFVGLIAFGGYYLWAYTPSISGWTQDAALTRPGAHLTDDGAVNIAATIAFTAVAALTAGAIVLGISRRNRPARVARASPSPRRQAEPASSGSGRADGDA